MKQHIMSNLTVATVSLFLTSHAFAGEPKPDAELQRLVESLDNAGSQSQLNIASGKIAEYWDKKLAEVEQKVIKKLTPVERVEFEASKKRFITYREKEVEFRTSFHGRGTIGSSMASSVYSSMTEHRVEEMEKLLAGSLEPRVGNPKEQPEEG